MFSTWRVDEETNELVIELRFGLDDDDEMNELDRYMGLIP